MLHQILTNTPRWVWVLLAALLWLGLSQTRPRSASLERITLLPLAMMGWSLYGTIMAFGATPSVLLCWLMACALTCALVLTRTLPAATRYDFATRRFTLPGSSIPLLLIMGIFLSKYALGALGAMQGTQVHENNLGLSFAALYGAFSGVFLGHAARLWRLAAQSNPELPGTV